MPNSKYVQHLPKDEEKNTRLWESIHNELKKEFGLVAYKSWLIRLKIIGFTPKGELFLSLPTDFLKDWVVNHYSKYIENLCKNNFKQVRKVEIVVNNNQEFTNLREFQNNEVFDFNDESSSPLDPRFTFKNFVVGKSNELAFAAAKRVSENKSVSFNPLFLFGGVGLGKTHLANAIGVNIKQKFPDKTVLYISAEKFTQQYIESVKKIIEMILFIFTN